MQKHNFVTIADLTKDQLLYLIKMAQEFERHPNRALLQGKVVATLFFEPSTRTQLKHHQGRNAERHHPDGEQLCRRHRDAPLY